MVDQATRFVNEMSSLENVGGVVPGNLQQIFDRAEQSTDLRWVSENVLQRIKPRLVEGRHFAGLGSREV